MNLLIHRRDLRINDNKIINSNKLEKTPIFIFDPIQIDKKKNEYFSNNLVMFLCETLLELNNEYKEYNSNLQIFYGDTIKVLKDIIKNNPIENVMFNLDYSPYSKKRDKNIEDLCEKNDINVLTEEDMLLIPIKSEYGLAPSSNEPYKVFTPFMKNLKKYDVDKPKKSTTEFSKKKLVSKYSIDINSIDRFYKYNDNLHVKPGRKEGLKLLKAIKKQKDYDKCRNFLVYQTTNLSAYINLGVLSIREVYERIENKLGKNSGIINELYWRDFYYNILYHYPHIVGNSFKETYDKIKWSKSKKNFEKWCNGETGFPIVDACMKQLNTTGYMHNRGRMIVSSFLTKDLQIDWRWGEKYFATQLVDYNISANNGGWQWSAGTGTDAQPYFRIFNPWTQSEKFDSECKYIKKWLPVLEDIPNKEIHKWYKFSSNYDIDYPEPMVDHSIERENTLKMFKKYT